MTWPSHMLVGLALAEGFGLSAPLVVLGSIAPDLIEMTVRPFHGKKGKSYLRHRGYTHSLAIWAAAFFLFQTTSLMPLFAGALFSHLMLDALNATGIPVWDGSRRRVTIFGGKVRNKTVGEFVIAGLIAWSVFVLAPAIHAPDADYFYRTGLIDRYEYERRKGLLKQIFTRTRNQQMPPWPKNDVTD